MVPGSQSKRTYDQKCREKEEADQNVNRNANTNNTRQIEKVPICKKIQLLMCQEINSRSVDLIVDLRFIETLKEMVRADLKADCVTFINI